jgi:hypothetical protein
MQSMKGAESIESERERERERESPPVLLSWTVFSGEGFLAEA